MIQLDWTGFYMEFATKLLAFRNDRQTLIRKIRNVYADMKMKFPRMESDDMLLDIDPFSIFGMFNKGISNANRTVVTRGLAEEFAVTAGRPESFEGVPVLNNLRATFYCFKEDRGEQDIEHLWKLFEAAITLADADNEGNRQTFYGCYDTVLRQQGIRWNITMGLYWIRPYTYINLDSRNRWYISNPGNMPADFAARIKNLNKVPSAKEYLEIRDTCQSVLKNGKYKYTDFPELSFYAWKISEEVNRQNREAADTAIADRDIDSVHYWIYSPGEGASRWDEFYEAGIMAIGWGEIGDLRGFSSKDGMKQRMNECYDPSLSYRNAAHATWQFVNELKTGDIVFVKKGKHQVIGRGIVTSDYRYDAERPDGFSNVRSVKWTHRGEWEHPGQAVTKTLTDITQYTNYVQKLKELFEQDLEDDEPEQEIIYPSYTPEDFLEEVYMEEEDYLSLVDILKNKKNVILQGAPGVGKTYAAKRLAYSIMGVRDIERVMMVQFHQSYSYEDFIMGYRPSAGGFELKKGAFYSFCKKAEIDGDNDYFFIIDEINRGNLSKIFGELFMLIENDKRGVSLQLLYSDEKFAVPKNVYLIGMMNTADRSLAMLDYALRRRFAFAGLKPGFGTKGFKSYRMALGHPGFDSLIRCVEKLNRAITEDEALGEGFCIGHSYFCNLDAESVDGRRLNAIVEYELIPLLKEYWFDEPDKVRDWSGMLRSAVK